MNISTKIINISILTYIYIPIFLFLFGWTNIIVALVCTSGILYAFICYTKNTSTQYIYINKWIILLACLIIILVCYAAGFGRFVDQSWDWEKHNAVLNDLSTRKWPVFYINKGENSMLTYYIGQYLVPSLFGKITHSFRVCEIVNMGWSVLGLLLLFIKTVQLARIETRLKQILTVFLLLFFNHGMLGEILRNTIYPNDFSKEPYVLFIGQGLRLGYGNHFFTLLDVFQQTIVIWLITLLFIEYIKKLRYYALLLLPVLLYGTICFIGFIPLALSIVIFRVISEKSVDSVKEMFHKNNLVMIPFALTLGLYFYGNVFSAKPNSVGFSMVHYGKWWPTYFIFIFAQVLIFYICIFRENKKNYLLFASVVLLCVIPLFQMGLYNDWLNAARPANFILAFFVIKSIMDKNLDKWKKEPFYQKILSVLLVLLLLSGCYNPFLQIKNNIASDDIGRTGKVSGSHMTNYSLESYASRKQYYTKKQKRVDLAFNYYSYDLNNNLFYKYIARSKKGGSNE